MPDRPPSLIRATVIAAAALQIGSALAGEPAAEPAVHAVKTVGAMTLEAQGRATDGTMVQRQRGFAAPASARWLATPAPELEARASVF